MTDRLKGMIGFAIKARKTMAGSYAVEGAVKHRKAKLVIMDGRASQNTIRQFEAMCANNGVKMIKLEESGVLESLLGKDNSTVLAVIDGGFAEAIQEILKKE